MAKMDIEKITEWAVVVGATNIGLTELGFNIVKMISDATAPIVATIAYIAIGLSGVYQLYMKFK